MSSTAWKASVTEDRTVAKIDINQDNETTTSLMFRDSSDLDQLIHDLARVRAEMDPPVPLQPTEATLAVEARSAAFIARGERQNGMRPILLRHSGLGWIGFLFDDDSATVLAASLTNKNL